MLPSPLDLRLWLAAALVAALAWGGIQTLRLSQEAKSHAETRAERDRINAAAARAALEASETLRRHQEQQARAAEEVRRAHEEEKAALRRTADSLRRDLDGVRNAFTAYAAGGGPAGGTSAPSGEARAGALGDVLGEGVRLVGELAEAAERHAADARALWAEREGLRCATAGNNATGPAK